MARTLAERSRDARAWLERSVDGWVATSSPTGRAHLVPLNVAWDGEVLVLASPSRSATARNAASTGRARVALGEFRDVVMVECDVTAAPWREAAARYCEHFVATRGWDPTDEPYEFDLLVARPTRIQVWREVDELAGREVMRDGAWLTDQATSDRGDEAPRRH